MAGCDPSTITPGTAVELRPDALESSAGASAATPFGPATLVVQYNGDANTGSVNRWSWSEDGGATWTDCDARAPCPASCCRAGAAAGSSTVPLVERGLNWAGDPVVATGAPGQVVMLNMAGPPTNAHEQVVASVSLDGGRTFLRTVRVNNQSGGCGGGSQDQPHATFDMGTSPPTLWVVWRHRGTDPGTYGGCVRYGFVEGAAGTIRWGDDAVPVLNMDRDDDFYGQGGMLIAARTVGQFTRVSVMYSNTDHMFSDCAGGKNIAWDTVTSDTLGIDWYKPIRITSTSTFDWCAAGDQVQLGLREFWFTQDPATGDYWAAVHESPSRIGIFASRDEGASWNRVRDVTEPGRTVFQPNIAVDAAGRVLVTWWRDQGFRVQRMAMGFGQPAGRWTGYVPLTDMFPGGPGQSAFGGDYQSLIAAPSGQLPGGATFFGAWSRLLRIQTLPITVTP